MNNYIKINRLVDTLTLRVAESGEKLRAYEAKVRNGESLTHEEIIEVRNLVQFLLESREAVEFIKYKIKADYTTVH